MTDMQETRDLADHKFESLANTINLDDMPNGDEDAERGRNEGVWMRAAAVILQDDSEQLYAKFQDDESADFWLTWLEDFQKFIGSQETGLEILKACETRLLVCINRYSVENDIVPDQ